MNGRRERLSLIHAKPHLPESGRSNDMVRSKIAIRVKRCRAIREKQTHVMLEDNLAMAALRP